MNIVTFPTGIYGANTYLVSGDAEGECIIVDPGGSFDLIKQMAEKYNVVPKHILLTHGHFDHIGALNEVRSYYKAEVYAHAECSKAIFDPLLNLSVYAGLSGAEQVKCEPVEHVLSDCDEIILCGLRIKAIHSPGHSKGSMVYIVEKCAFTGDVLFKMSIGRTDFLGSDAQSMGETLTRLKKILPTDIKILPGHGEESYMSYELENNPFISKL